MITEKTRKYWIAALRGWAEDRLSPPQFDECCAVLDNAEFAIGVVEAARAVVVQFDIAIQADVDDENVWDAIGELREALGG